MIIVGLTGISGSGKSLVSSLFADFGFAYIDADAVYRELTVAGSPLNEAIRSAFGSNALTAAGELNRGYIGSLVFAPDGKDNLKLLNSITHSAIIAEVNRRIGKLDESNVPALIFDAPQLFESGFDKDCDFIVTVKAPMEDRIARLIKRDSISRERALSRINSQNSDSFFDDRSDFIIVNDGNVDALKVKVSSVAEKILCEVK